MEEGKDIIPISANVSRASLHYSGIVDKYQKIVSQYGLPIEDIQIEITESAMIDNTDIQTLVDEFHAAGFTLLLDDFGNGYSSLATLNVLRFDILKIDKSLVDYIGSTDGERLLSCIVELAQNLGFRITAEGVETKEQLEFLQNLHCDDIQGYYFSRPLCKSDFEKML
jgi:EAL domain-containing protein (putative c-di-GMP-specific phosphodiesterase class I)